MADAHIPLCVDCMALTIDDRIIDHVSKDLPYTSETECQDQPELMIECQKQDILPSLPNLSAAAEAGCQFCAFLLVFVVKCCLRYSVAIKSVEFSDEEDFKNTQISVKIDRIRYIRKHDPEVAGFADHFPQTGIIGLAADVCIYDENSQEPLLKTTAWLPLSAKTVLNHLRNPRIGTKPVSQEPLSYENLALITGWIKDCDSHDQCCSSAPHQLPTRLIDIGDTEDEAKLRLVNTAEHENLRDELPPYIALSYCWGLPTGSQRHFKTTPATLKGFLSGIPYQEMPQTLRDVVKVTRKLGLRYIWIDALCIVQDEADQSDWRRESVRMKEVYGNAYLTIAPISSHSSFDGFLSPRKYVYMRVPIRSIKKPEINDVCLVRQPTHEGRFWHGAFSDDVSDSTWIQRGWTLQEQELSRRILYFGERTIHFTCRTHSWSGDLDEALPGRTCLLPEPDDLHWCLLNFPGERQPGIFDSTYQPWYDICSNFSERTLTSHDDKLPAISGLANSYATSLKLAGKEDTYLVGIWGNDLLRGLCWAKDVSSSISLPPIPTPYCKPSWTWASHNGSVTWSNYGGSPTRFVKGRCTIVVHLHGLDQDPFGMIQGYLTIDGYIEKITTLVPLRDIDNRESHWTWQYTAERDGGAAVECQPDFDLEGLDHFSEGANLSLLLLAESFNAEDTKEAPWLVGLILTQNPAACNSEFVRVGVFRIRDKSSLFSGTKSQHIVLA